MLPMSAIMAFVLWLYKAIGIGEYHIHGYLAAWPILPVFALVNVFFRLYHGNPFCPSMPLFKVILETNPTLKAEYARRNGARGAASER